MIFLNKNLIQALLLVSTLILSASMEPPTQLLSGPMVGHTTSTTANIWVETDQPAEVTVRYWVEAGSRPIIQDMASGQTAQEAPHTGVINIENLPDGGTVHYELEIDGRAIRAQTAQAFSLLPSADSASNFTVGFTSCMNPSQVLLQPLWTQVGVYRPDAFFLIGDNNYMPSHPDAYETSEETVKYAMSRYHRYLRDWPGLRSILASTPTYGMWDDHDFGPNNSDRTFQWKELNLDLFRKYWPNPAAGTAETPGTFYSFQVADVEFFMLDNRYHRDPNLSPDRETMLGEGQLSWLKGELESSTATFKVIVAGHTLTVDRGDDPEDWARFGNERENFLEWMFAEEIEGVFFLSGDWHVGSLSRIEYSDNGYPLYELISSEAGVGNVEDDLHMYRHHRQTSGHNRRFEGPIINDIRDYNFGLLEFSGTEENRSVMLRIIDYHGEVRISHQLTPADLSFQNSQ